MSELKPCQMRPERAAEKLQESYDYMTRVMPESKRSQATANLLEAISVAIATLRRAQPSNEPLTLEQLRKMDNERIFVILNDDVCIPALVAFNTEDCSNEDEDDVVYLTNNLGGRSTYEKMLKMGANFYRRPPERSENDGNVR